jgi:hypothetical protein|tara:strand:- start:405 stop:782 length:378 start_codon:yes stop_codon:yes gene_type:complete
MKQVTFELDRNQTFYYQKYIQKYNYKTPNNILYYLLYKDIKSTKWYKYLPEPSLKPYKKNININKYSIEILYYFNKWDKINLIITNNIQKPDFFSKFIDIKTSKEDFRIIIVNYIRHLCFNNDIF